MPDRYTLVSQVIPPALLRWLDRIVLQRSIRLTGDYASWAAALADSDGYDDARVLEQVAAAAQRVQEGEAAYDQDGVTFDAMSPDWPLLAILLAATANGGGKLSVLDYGGSLGNTWRRAKPFLARLPDARWCIVEQPALVELGKRRFEDERLSFWHHPTEAVTQAQCNVLILGSVLQYLPAPWETLDDLLHLTPWDAVVVTRTPVWNLPDRLAIQHTPRFIYGSAIRYPSWVLNAPALEAAVAAVGSAVAMPADHLSITLGRHAVEYASTAWLRPASRIAPLPQQEMVA
jgi:putative methyltransferase (TIGR04325 family)